MAPLNTGNTYHRLIGAIYLRETEGKLVNVTGDEVTFVQDNWFQIRGRISETEVTDTTALDWVDWSNGPVQIREFPIFVPDAETGHIDTKEVRVCEVEDGTTGYVKGIFSFHQPEDKLSEWAETFFLLGTHIQPMRPKFLRRKTHAETVSEQIADVFDDRLRNTPRDDQWLNGGRQVFIDTVFGFVSRGVPVECCLPAFPCKSPNPLKVGGTKPDRAEAIALRVLRNFLKEVKKIYAPGAKLLIISDGHVFSDCIGVDDDRVTSYDEQLKVFYKNSVASEGVKDAIEFRGLEEILFSEQDVAAKFEHEALDEYDLQHPVPTKRDPLADLSRKVMMATCGVDRDNFRDLVKKEDKKVLPLYRGHNRFVLEDSAYNPHCRTKSKNQRKKIASQVSEEMILRNQAYSNLVEYIYPSHVRFSIHAHPNSGPKFGVRLFPKSAVEPIDSLHTRNEPNPTSEFQIPTPWHNSIVKVRGEKKSYLAHSQVAMQALESGQFKGGWVDRPKGGYFYLQKVERLSSPESMITEVDDEAERKLERERIRRARAEQVKKDMIKKGVTAPVAPAAAEMVAPPAAVAPVAVDQASTPAEVGTAPALADPEPAVVNAEPAIVTDESAVVDAQPTVVDTEPTVVSAEPPIVDTASAVLDTKPVVADAKQAVVNAEPASVAQTSADVTPTPQVVATSAPAMAETGASAAGPAKTASSADTTSATPTTVDHISEPTPAQAAAAPAFTVPSAFVSASA